MQALSLFWRSPSRRSLAAGVIAAILTFALGCAASVAAEPVVVRIENFSFGPETITVASGISVTWANGDGDPHVIFTETGLFRSKTLKMGDRYTFTFATPGEYPYLCLLHPHMTGKVIVKAAAE